MGKKGPQPPRPAEQAAQRLAVIVDAAERAALNVIDGAEKEAQRYLQEAQARADQIVAQQLREAADKLDGGRGSDDDRAAPLLRPVDSPSEPGPEAVSDAEGPRPGGALRAAEPPARDGSAAARLLATQMAVSGSSREEIEQRLRRGFEIEDTSEILDAILGPEG
jgi:hypothetical protein